MESRHGDISLEFGGDGLGDVGAGDLDRCAADRGRLGRPARMRCSFRLSPRRRPDVPGRSADSRIDAGCLAPVGRGPPAMKHRSDRPGAPCRTAPARRRRRAPARSGEAVTGLASRQADGRARCSISQLRRSATSRSRIVTASSEEGRAAPSARTRSTLRRQPDSSITDRTASRIRSAVRSSSSIT